MREVAALFVRADSVYKTMPGVDAWDIERDARKWPGGVPVVAHPPCRAWGRFSHMAKPRDGERDHAPWAVEQIRRYGGVLEHPAESKLWHHCGLPVPGRMPDSFGGWSLYIRQCDWGHRAEKLTWLYVVGLHVDELPEFPPPREATHVIAQGREPRPDLGRGRLKKGVPGWRPEVTPREREYTPTPLAEWLVDLARRCRVAQEMAA
jgi:hypothetical protein